MAVGSPPAPPAGWPRPSVRASPFRVTELVEGRRWAWAVGGVAATSHEVEPLGGNRCRVAMGVPWPVAPYLAVCAVALRRIERLAT